MEFHHYKSFWSCVKETPEGKKLAKITDDPGRALIKFCNFCEKRGESAIYHGNLACCESLWWLAERPFYNVYPSIVEMLLDTSLDVPGSCVSLPLPTILIRLPVGSSSPIKTILASVMSDDCFDTDGIHMDTFKGSVIWKGVPKTSDRKVVVNIQHNNFDGNLSTYIHLNASETVEEVIQRNKERMYKDNEARNAVTQALRIVVGCSILANDKEIIQPIVLDRDRLKYESSDEPMRKRMEDRAARVNGRGFSIGKDLENQLAKERELAPHIRRPHMALFWTGKGRTEPRLQLRRGALIKHKSITDIPTGFLGGTDDESEESQSVSAVEGSTEHLS